MILPIAWHTFLESLRNRILYAILIVVIGIILASFMVGYVTVDEETKVIGDVGLSAVSLFGAIISIFLGTHLVYVEMERRTVYTILARSVRREEFLFGKFLGLVGTVTLTLMVMSAVFLGYYLLNGGALSTTMGIALYFTLLEMILVIGIALNFSVVSTPIEGAIISFCIYLVGHASGSLVDVATEVPEGVGRTLIWTVYYLIPNLHNFNVRLEAVHQIPIPPAQVGWRTLYAVCYTGALLFLAAVLFRRKKL